MNTAMEEEAELPLAAFLGRKRGKKTKANRTSKATTSNDRNTEPVKIEEEAVEIEPEAVRIEPEAVRIETEAVRIETEAVHIEQEPVLIEPEPVGIDEESSRNGPRVSVSMFDDSVENHFRVMDTIAKHCGEVEEDRRFEEGEIQSLSSSITFLREWADFKYEPRDVRFASAATPDGKDSVSGITLSQFSSATVPKTEALSQDKSPELSQDFVMYVGGPVWALDWCPRVYQSPGHHPICEFVAIAAHPPGSSYHKLGEPLTGRGAIQIWCILNAEIIEGAIDPIVEKTKWGHSNTGKPLGRPRKKPLEEKPKRPLGRPRKTPIENKPKRPLGRPRKNPIEEKPTGPKRPRGRPKKNPIEEIADKEGPEEQSAQPNSPRGTSTEKPIEEYVDNLDGSSNYTQALTVQNPEESLELHSMDCVPADTRVHALQKDHGEKRKSCGTALISYVRKRKLNNMESAGSSSECQPLINDDEESGPPVSDHQIHENSRQDPEISINVQDNGYSEIWPRTCSVPKDVALPRIILCLAHHGKVAWDVKWRPPNDQDSKCKHRMGYLAVLSGNGSLEVWDVPLPRAIEVVYSSSCGEGTDPRFVKLAPVFRCSKLKCGGENSIPLTVEWSTSPAHEYLLAGCHDGTVALWKFSASNASQDTRPLLCFSADTNPIRALAWAPVGSNSEGANLIATAGHGGLKFWDLRDPFRPLWDLDHLPRFIYSLDWLPDPRCVLLSFDDGSIKVISLVKAVSDDPVTGEPLVGTKQPGLHNISCLPFAIWSVHVSRLTGMVAYCCADGTVLRFQLTSKNVEKDPRRHRAPHFLCVSLTMEESDLTINTPVPNTPFPLKVVRKGANDKMTKDSTSEDQTLALCHGDAPGIESGENVLSLKSKETQRSEPSKKKAEDDLALVCVDEELISTQEHEVGEKVAPHNRKKQQKTRFTEKKPDDDLALVCIDADPTNAQEQETGGKVASLKMGKKTQTSSYSKKRQEDDLALVCMDEDPTNTHEQEIGEKVASVAKIKKSQKSRFSKKKPEDDLALACIDEEPENTQEEEIGKTQKSKPSKKRRNEEQALVCMDEDPANTREEETEKEVDIFPDKLVAMHRVRWNMNKGSERWLCYGGAAGIVRCQEIVLSDIERAWAMKK